jgi:hypothetical protein
MNVLGLISQLIIIETLRLTPTNFQTESLFVLEENPKEQTAKERAERRESREKKFRKK